jgi:hypothetical protein
VAEPGTPFSGLDPYYRLLMAFTLHLARHHEIDAFALVEELQVASMLTDDDVAVLTVQLRRLIPRYRT